jgi:hypothetical protein
MSLMFTAHIRQVMSEMSRFWIIALVPLIGVGSWHICETVVLAQFPTVGTSVPVSAVDPSVPAPVQQAVLQAAANQTGIPSNTLMLKRAVAKIWSDSCLGLSVGEQMCAAVLVKGWEVTVGYQQREWVYRTNSSGQVVILDPAGGRLSGVVMPPAAKIPADQLPQKWEKKVVFYETRAGGLTGFSQGLALHKDGRLMRQSQSRQTSPTEGQQILILKKSQVKAFKKKLDSLHFGQFNGLHYPAPSGAADYFTVTLSNGQTTVRYTDLNGTALPQDLQSIIREWQTLTASVPR